MEEEGVVRLQVLVEALVAVEVVEDHQQVAAGGTSAVPGVLQEEWREQTWMPAVLSPSVRAAVPLVAFSVLPVLQEGAHSGPELVVALWDLHLVSSAHLKRTPWHWKRLWLPPCLRSLTRRPFERLAIGGT